MPTHLHTLCPSRRKVSSLSLRTVPSAIASSAAGFCHCSSSCRTKSCPIHYFRKRENVLTPSSSTVDALQYTDNAAQCVACGGLVLRASTQTPGALHPKPRALATPWHLPFPWGWDTAPHQAHPPQQAPNTMSSQENIASSFFSLLSNHQWVDTHPG